MSKLLAICWLLALLATNWFGLVNQVWAQTRLSLEDQQAIQKTLDGFEETIAKKITTKFSHSISSKSHHLKKDVRTLRKLYLDNTTTYISYDVPNSKLADSLEMLSPNTAKITIKVTLYGRVYMDNIDNSWFFSWLLVRN